MKDNKDEDVIKKPVLSFTPDVAAWVTDHYKAANVILEYGSGGSTVLAAEMGDKQVFSVESDGLWMKRMQAYLDQAGLSEGVTLHRGNIGQTGKWGRPRSDKAWRRYHLYPNSVWDRDDFVEPDLILIDGRCRAACLMTAMLRISKPVTVLFDDYEGRSQYERIEQWIKPVEMRERMAKFQVEPFEFPRADLTDILTLYTKTF